MGTNIILLICITGLLLLLSVVHSQDVRGTPGFDYPNYHSIPSTTFKCSEQLFIPGFYADLETRCQVFHFCFKDNQESFLCPVGTTFNQQKLICDVWFSSNCSLAPMYYNVNSGPAMKNAAKKLPMFLKLRSRSQGKLPIQSSTAVYETMASLLDNSNIVSVDEPKSIDQVKISDNSKTSQDSAAEVKRALSDSSNVIDSEMQQDEGDEAIVEEQDSENLVYDPARNGYGNFDKSNTGWPDDDPVDVDGFYDYNTNDEYQDMNSDVTYGSNAEFLKRHLQPGQFAERIRRRPTYVVVPEDGDDLISDPSLLRGIRSPNEHEPTDSTAGEKVDVNGTTETSSPEPFPRPTRIPHHLLGYSTETPMTSEEFERAIIEDLIAPVQAEADILASAQDEANMQRDQFVYDDQVTHYETESMYDWRKPMYVLAGDEERFIKSGRPRRSPDEPETSESQTPNSEPFPRPTRIPHHLLGYSTEVPMTSEEFERAIIEDLIAPVQAEADLLASINSENTANGESQESTNMQGDQFVYVDDPMRDYETEAMYDWRRPMYVVVEDENKLNSGRPRRSPDESDTSESQTESPEPFPRPTRIPHHLLGYSTEVPMTSEEFERAIIEDLIAPVQAEADLLASTNPEHAANGESQESANMQGDQFVYEDGAMTDYEAESMHDWRRPIYVQDGDESKSGRPRRSPDETEASETANTEPFPRPTRIPHHLLGYSTEVPMTSEEFERAIIEDLIAPVQAEADLLASINSEHAANGESQESTNMQGDQLVYVSDPMRDYETEAMYDWGRPMYVLVNDESKLKSGRPRRSPDDPEISESQTQSPEPFPRPTRIPHHLLEYSTEVPMTSEEFERAIIEDLIAPVQAEADLLASTNPEHANSTPLPESAASYEESQASSDIQGDQSLYVDMASNMNHENENPETKFRMNLRDNLYRDEYGYYRSSFVPPGVESSKLAYPERRPAQFQYYRKMRPHFPFTRIPYIRGNSQLAADAIPQMNGMMLGEYLDQKRYYPGSPAYEPLNYNGFYEPEAQLAYDYRYSNPFGPTREELLHYSLPGYEGEYSGIEVADSASLGGLPMENENLVASPEQMADSDLFEASSQTDLVNEDLVGGDEESKETYYVFDFDEDEQVSELNKNENDVTGADNSTADAFELNATDAENTRVSSEQSLATGSSEKEVSSTFERLATTKLAGSPLVTSDAGLVSNAKVNQMAFPESMDFGPYGFGANMGQQYGMLDSIHGSQNGDKFMQRKGDDSPSNLDKLSALQERIRSMKQGKFGVFKKYLSSSKGQK